MRGPVLRPANEALVLVLVTLLVLPPAAPAAIASTRVGTPTTTLALTAGAGSLTPADATTRARVEAGFGKLPLYFIENRGQIDPRVTYYVQGATNGIYFTKTGVVLVLTSRAGGRADNEGLLTPAASSPRRPSGESEEIRRFAIRLDFEGANPEVKLVGRERTSAVVSYFKGRPSEWKTALPTYAGVVYEELWPGIDLVYGSESGQPKYSFLVKPGADPGRIRLVYRGASAVRLEEGGRLAVETPAGGFAEERPYAYQEGQGAARAEVTAAFALEAEARGGEHRFGFRVGAYDRTRPLVLDPVVLAYCGYIGGSGSDVGQGIAVDGSGSAYVTGYTPSTQATFPVVVGSWNTTYAGGTLDAFVAKVNAAGTALVYCGYIGGTQDDRGSGIAVDSSGNAYVAGYTSSTEAQAFPVTVGPDSTQNGLNDVFVAKVNAAGTALVYCGYIGGSLNDFGLGIAADGAGSAYVVGQTASANFPVVGTPGWPHANTYTAGGSDAFVAKVNAAGTALTYSGYIGGSGADIGRGIAVDAAGNAYVTGDTNSPDSGNPSNQFPLVVGPDTSQNGLTDVFVAKVNSAGTALVYCGYIGGTGSDTGYGIAVDGAGAAYVVGTAPMSTGFPVVTASWPNATTGAGLNDGFVAKVNAAGTALVYSGYIAGTGEDYAYGVAVDGSGNAYVTGQTSSGDFPVTVGPDLTINGTPDAYVLEVDAAGATLVYCGYIGGSQNDGGQDIAVDGSGNAYVIGTTNSTPAQSFPVTVGPDLIHNGGNDAFVAKVTATATALYRSVGPGNTTDLNTSTRTVAISGTTATFSGSMPDKVGVGDVLKYLGTVAFIHGRTSDQVYTVASASGGTPTAAGPGTTVSVYRAYTSLFDWEAQTENPSIGVNFDTSTDLVAANALMNVACYGDAEDATQVTINGWATDAGRYIRIYTPYLFSEVGATQRHKGVWDVSKYVIRSTYAPIDVGDAGAGTNSVWIDGLQVWLDLVTGGGNSGIITNQTGAANHRFSNNIVRGDSGAGAFDSIGIYFYSAAAGSVVRIWNNIVYDFSRSAGAGRGNGISVGGGAGGMTGYVYNNTVYNCFRGFFQQANGTIVAKNNVYRAGTVGGSPTGYSGITGTGSDYNSSEYSGDSVVMAPRVNTASPWYSGATAETSLFVAPTGTPRNLHLLSSTIFTNVGADLTSDPNLAFSVDIDKQLRPSGPATWDIGADEYQAPATAVGLVSFEARGLDGAVDLRWETASELDNLGFHLYRGASANGPWTRLNASLIPGLGSSPEGKSYRYVDSGLVNGTTYFYRLEDVDRHGGVTSHGPVPATPVAGLAEPGEGEGPGEPSPPGETPARGPQRKAHGDPTQQSLRVLERTASGVTLELVTGGFYSEEQEDGTSKLLVPGFFDHAEPGLPTVPTRRLWTDAFVGRGVSLVSIEPSDLVSFPGLSVPLAGRPVAVAASDGTYRASSIPVRPTARSARDLTRSGQPGTSAMADSSALFPSSQAFVHQTAFQGEQKKAYVELAPLQVDEATGGVSLARRLVVRLAFAGSVAGETGRGNVGQSNPLVADATGTQVLARLATRFRGLHSVAFEQIPGLTSSVAPSALRLSRLGSPVAFHLEPHRRPFGPGSVLSFLADGADSAYANEAVYELSIAPGGIQMRGVLPSRRPAPATPLSLLRHERSFETDATYLPALLEARDLWMWDLGIPGGGNASYSFTLDSPVLVPGTARLSVELQGGSDTEADPDHHVLVFVNGSLVGETRFDGMVPHTLALDFPTSLLLDGENTLRLENAGDTGSTASFVYLDRFSVEVPREISPLAGVLEGRADQRGRASLAAAPGALLLDVTGSVPRFLTRAAADGRLAWNAEKDHRYLAVSPEAFLTPEIRPAPSAALRSPTNQADWIVVAPQALLPAAETLRAHRESQGLAARAVSFESVVDEFGYGEAGTHALQGFLASAFHDWQAPAPRYVLLLGEASYDPKGRLSGTSRPDLVPSPLTKSTFLWTPADPLYAAVNGSDSLPDIAIGRINAASLAEATSSVQKVLDFENSGQSLSGKATLVADNPDTAGEFESNQDEIATLLPSRSVEKLFLAQLGAAGTKAAVRSAFDSGLSLMSYVGHGSSGLWASEAILRSPDVASFAPQPAQPLVLAMTCSNGYFLSPFNNSLAERLVLADKKGAIAAFAPSGLSRNDAAHVYHRAVVAELESGQHPRLGDLLLAAQASYAATGAFPELLQIYNLLGDPGTRIR